MGKDSGASQQTSYSRDPISGYQTPLYEGLNSYLQNYLNPGASSYNQAQTAGMTGQQTGNLNLMGNAVAGLFGLQGSDMNGQAWNPTVTQQQSNAGNGYTPTTGVGSSAGAASLLGANAGGSSDFASTATSGKASTLGDYVNSHAWPNTATTGTGSGTATGTATTPAATIDNSGNSTVAAQAANTYPATTNQDLSGGIYGMGNAALQRILDPNYTDPTNDPVFQKTMENAMAGQRQSYGQSGLGLSGNLNDAILRSSADLLLNEQDQRTALQNQVGQYGINTAMSSLGNYQNASALPQATQQDALTKAYNSWLQQEQQGRQDSMNAWQQGTAMAGASNPTSTTSSSGQGIGSILGTLLGLSTAGTDSILGSALGK
jgi:hypothetical protein